MTAAVLTAVLVGGCGSGWVTQGSPADTRPRSEKVAAAWEGSAAVRQWRAGFHPLDSQGWRPPGGFRSDEDKAAYLEGNFVLFGEGTAPLFGDAPPPADATSFTVSAGHGGCDAGAAVDVLEGEHTVVLAGRVLVRTGLDAGAGCDAMMRMKSVPVTLVRPLGDRLLLDAATGAPLEYGR
ncbi:hypothetical protein ACWDYJ_19690 [Streptomyces sp. NPDC003042]